MTKTIHTPWNEILHPSAFPYKNMALLDENFKTIICFSEQKFDELHLALSCEQLSRMTRVKQDEIFITNDFSCGVIDESDFFFLFILQELAQTKIYALIQLNFMRPGQIPPFPFFMQNKIQQAPLQALCSNHKNGTEIQKFLETEILGINKFRDRWRKYFPMDIFCQQKEDYFAAAKKIAKRLLAEKPMGQASVEKFITSSEILRLKLKIDEQNIQFDFSGTTQAKSQAWPESLSSSWCFAFFASLYGFKKPFHHSHFSIFQIQTSPNSMVSAKVKNSQAFQFKEIASSMNELLSKSFLQVHRKPTENFVLRPFFKSTSIQPPITKHLQIGYNEIFCPLIQVKEGGKLKIFVPTSDESPKGSDTKEAEFFLCTTKEFLESIKIQPSKLNLKNK